MGSPRRRNPTRAARPPQPESAQNPANDEGNEEILELPPGLPPHLAMYLSFDAYHRLLQLLGQTGIGPLQLNLPGRAGGTCTPITHNGVDYVFGERGLDDIMSQRIFSANAHPR